MAQVGCFGARNLVAVRASRLNDDGTRICPNTDGSAYLRGGAIRFAATADIDAGATDVQRDGDGNICNTDTSADAITGVSLELELCIFDMEMLEILTGGVIAVTGGTTYGWEYPGASDTAPHVEFHAWARAWDGGGQAAAPYQFLHLAFYNTTWTPPDLGAEENALTLPLAGKGQENASISIGSFDDIPPEFLGTFGAAWFDNDAPAAGIGDGGLSCGYLDTPVCTSS